MLKVAVVGVGGISGAHIPKWQDLENAELVAMCDVRPEQMDKYDNVRKYTDIDEMLESEKLDILDICLPTYLHVPVAIKAMEKGINVITEKPISLHPEDVKKVYDVAEKNNVKFMVAQVLRFWPEYLQLKEIYDNKTYGELLSGNMTRLGNMPRWSWDNWMTDPERSGLVPYDLHIHDLDFMVYAFGTPKNSVNFRSTRENQDCITAIYDYGDKFISVEAAWYNGMYPFSANFHFQFEKAVVEFKDGKFSIYDENGEVLGDNTTSAESSGVINLPATNAYANEIIYFADCVMNNKKPEIIKPDELENVILLLNKFSI